MTKLCTALGAFYLLVAVVFGFMGNDFAQQFYGASAVIYLLFGRFCAWIDGEETPRRRR